MKRDDSSYWHDNAEKFIDAGVQGMTTLTSVKEIEIDPLGFGLDGPEPIQESEKTDWIEDETKYYILTVSDSRMVSGI